MSVEDLKCRTNLSLDEINILLNDETDVNNSLRVNVTLGKSNMLESHAATICPLISEKCLCSLYITLINFLSMLMNSSGLIKILCFSNSLMRNRFIFLFFKYFKELS